MHWFTKVAAFKLLALTPLGAHIHAFMRQRVTKSTVPTEERIAQKLEVGWTYVGALPETLRNALKETTVVDIGSGWMPTIPLLFYCLGVDRIRLFDVRPYLTLNNVAATAALVARQLEKTADCAGCPIRRLPPTPRRGDDVSSYLARLGMLYERKLDVRGLQRSGPLRVAICTQVLLHLRYDEIRRLLQRVAIALGPDGVLLATVHLHDLYSDWDSSLPRFNKFRYPNWMWEWLLTSRMMYFNRLIASDYARVLKEAGFHITRWVVTPASEQDMEALRSLRLCRRFRNVPLDELAAMQLFVMAMVDDRIAGESSLPSQKGCEPTVG